MKPLNEQQIRAIVKDEMRKNYMSGSPDVPPHTHNGTDNLNIDPSVITGFTPLPVKGQFFNTVTKVYELGFASETYTGVGAGKTGLVGGNGTHASQYVANSGVYQYPIPIVVGNGVGNQGAFNAGYAPEGTLVYFAGSPQKGLYIRFDGHWEGVGFPLTA